MDPQPPLAPADREAEVVAAERAQAEVERAERARRRLRRPVRDMVLSLLVVGAVVMLVAQPWNRPEATVRTADWRPVAVAFAGTVDFPVLAPTPLPADWRATSVRIEPTVDGRTALHVGWITAGEQYAALEQSDTADVRYVPALTDSGALVGAPLVVAGRTWQRLASADGRTRSLASTDGTAVAGAGTDRVVTYVVTGSADWPELDRLVSSLAVVGPTPAASAG